MTPPNLSGYTPRLNIFHPKIKSFPVIRKKEVLPSLTILIGFFDNCFAFTNHCSVKSGSIIEFDLSP